MNVSNAVTAQLAYALLLNPAPLIVAIPDEAPILASLESLITNSTGSAINV